MPSKLDSVAISLESLRYENRTQAEYIAKLIPRRVHAKRRDLMQFRIARDSKLVGKCFGIICALLEYNNVSRCNLHVWFRRITLPNYILPFYIILIFLHIFLTVIIILKSLIIKILNRRFTILFLMNVFLIPI